MILPLYLFDLPDGIVSQAELVIAKGLENERLHLLQSNVRVILQQRDALTHALNTLRLQFLGTGRNGVQHVIHIGIIQQCAMDDGTVGKLVAGCPTHLSVVYQHVVMTSTDSVDAQLAQHQQQQVDIAVEGKSHILSRCYKRQHQVRQVGIHTATAALPAIHRYAVPTAVVGIHFILCWLRPKMTVGVTCHSRK